MSQNRAKQEKSTTVYMATYARQKFLFHILLVAGEMKMYKVNNCTPKEDHSVKYYLSPVSRETTFNRKNLLSEDSKFFP